MFFLRSAAIAVSHRDAEWPFQSAWSGRHGHTLMISELSEALDLKDADGALKRRGGVAPLHRASRNQPSEQGGSDWRGSTGDGEIRLKSLGKPIEAFNEIRANVLADCSKYWKELALSFYGSNRPGAKNLGRIARIILATGHDVWFSAAYFCIKAFSETDSH